MKKLTIFVSFTPEQMDYVFKKFENRTSKQECLGFWSDVEPNEKESISNHIASTVNYFLDTNREEIYFGCDKTELDDILSIIKTEAFEIMVIHGDEFTSDTDMNFNRHWLKKESEHIFLTLNRIPLPNYI